MTVAVMWLGAHSSREVVFSCWLYEQNAHIEHMTLQKEYYAQQLVSVMYITYFSVILSFFAAHGNTQMCA
jgi:hypothetical protein